MHADHLDDLKAQTVALHDHRTDIDALTTTLHEMKHDLDDDEREQLTVALDVLALAWAQLTIAGTVLVELAQAADRG